mmetsp:Transcript_32783/g.75472  ORF Transcript_32783/g.75472 Transcript_32783/m.75472 type:complete len:96 (-) Transcript_32783:539-826(-)
MNQSLQRLQKSWALMGDRLEHEDRLDCGRDHTDHTAATKKEAGPRKKKGENPLDKEENGMPPLTKEEEQIGIFWVFANHALRSTRLSLLSKKGEH